MAEVARERVEDRIDRGLALWRARRAGIRPAGGGRWRVPASDGSGGYVVDLQTGVCDCPDHKFNGGEECKHFWAAVLEAAAERR